MPDDANQKHIAFFKLMDAVSSGQCPVCHQLHVRLQHYFETLLYENVNNREFRAELRAAGGFCSTHAHQLAQYKDGLALAVIHLELIQAAHRGMSAPPARSPLAASALSARRGRRKTAASDGQCPACRVAQQQTESTLQRITRYADDPQFLAAYTDSAGLCVPHYRLLQQADAPLPDQLVDHQQRILERLAEQTSRFIDAENASSKHRQPLSRHERTVWKQIIDCYYGKSGALP